LLDTLERDRFQPPLTRDLPVDASLLRSLADAGEIVRVGDFYLSAEGARDARRIVRSAIADEGPITVARLRDLLGTTRKYAVPLAEWLDATGATRRQGDVRALGPNE
jgi:selenocysteine-specific elongation factor